MKKRLYKLTAEHICRAGALQAMVKRRLLRGMLLSRSQILPNKVLWSYRMERLPKSSRVSRQNTRCLHTGRPRGVFTPVGLSRHSLKLWSAEGRVQNLRTRL